MVQTQVFKMSLALDHCIACEGPVYFMDYKLGIGPVMCKNCDKREELCECEFIRV
jgi:hypothetical protein